MITAVMLTGAENPVLGRDMMFAVLMIVLNGIIGISLLCDGLQHLEQTHNPQGANTFLPVLIPRSVLSLILPVFTTPTEVGGPVWAWPVVYGIVKKCEGAAKATSTPGEGTTVEMLFPLYEGRRNR